MGRLVAAILLVLVSVPVVTSAQGDPAPLLIGGFAAVQGTEGLGVVVRSAPALSSDVRFRMPDGDAVQVVDGPREADEHVWYLIRRSEPAGEGWVASRYLVQISVFSGAPSVAAAPPRSPVPTSTAMPSVQRSAGEGRAGDGVCPMIAYISAYPEEVTAAAAEHLGYASRWSREDSQAILHPALAMFSRYPDQWTPQSGATLIEALVRIVAESGRIPSSGWRETDSSRIMVMQCRRQMGF